MLIGSKAMKTDPVEELVRSKKRQESEESYISDVVTRRCNKVVKNISGVAMNKSLTESGDCMERVSNMAGINNR
jgi:hypothetical protein